MSDQPYIKHPVVYGHPNDPDFETSCPKRAWAYAQIFDRIAGKRKQLEDSGRFKTAGRLNGELNRHIETMIEGKLSDAGQSEEDVYMGVKGKLDENRSTDGCIGSRRKEATYDGMDTDDEAGTA